MSIRRVVMVRCTAGVGGGEGRGCEDESCEGEGEGAGHWSRRRPPPFSFYSKAGRRQLYARGRQAMQESRHIG